MYWLVAMCRGVSLPAPFQDGEPNRTIGELYTQSLKKEGLQGTVLVRLNIDRQGRVTSAKAIRPPRLPFGKGMAILQDGEAGRSQIAPRHGADSRLCEIAEAAARAMRWEPAMHRGKPVRLTGLRMSFAFRA